MIKDLIRLASHLDSKGLTKEADRLDKVIKKIAQGYEYIDPAGGTHESGHVDPATGQPPERLSTDHPAFSEDGGFVSAGELGYNDATSGSERKSDEELRGLGYTAEPDSEAYNDAYDEFGGGEEMSSETPGGKIKDWAQQLVELMLASMGPGPYKLTEQRLKEIGPDKLTSEEKEIVGIA